MLITNREERQKMKYPITDKNIIIKHLGEILNDYNTIYFKRLYIC